MLKKRLDKILSLFLTLLLIFCSTCYADNVFVAGAPTSTTGTVNATGNVNIGTGNTGVGDRLYPGSLAKSSDSPTSANSITPATNKSSTIASSNGKSSSNIISNGYTWEKSNTENQAPVSQESQSPAENQKKGKGISSKNEISSNGPGNANNNSNADTTVYASSNPQGGLITVLSASKYASGGYNLLNAGIPNPVISSDGAALVNVTTKEIYYAKNLTNVYAPAGLTILLTGYLLLKYRQLTDVLTVTQNAVSNIESGATTVGLKAGDTITVKDALYALYMRSACDVANVIAENVAGSRQAFVTLMNQTATSFGTRATVFTNPTGLFENAQISNVYDMVLIMSNIVLEPMLNLVMQTPTYTLPATAHRGAVKITAKNEFINPAKKNYYPGVVSSRMGYTSKSKYTMASLVIHNGQYLVSVVMYSNNTQYVDSKRLMNFGRTAVDKLMSSNVNVGNNQSEISNDTVNNVGAATANESLLNTNQPTSVATTKKDKSDIISNGYTWSSGDTENQAPVVQTIKSPVGEKNNNVNVNINQSNNNAVHITGTSEQNSMTNDTEQIGPSVDANLAVFGNVINNNVLNNQNTASDDTGGAWIQDDKGWTFTKTNGQKAKNEWVVTSGKRYCIDADGYMITGWREFSNGAIYYFNPTSGEMRYNTWVNTTTGAYYLQADGTLARAEKGQTKTIATQVGNYIIDENGKAIQRVQ